MKISLFGAGGNIGRRIAREALDRGHQVTAGVRDPAHFQSFDPRLRVVKGDATDASSVAETSRGADAIVSSISPRPGSQGQPPSSLTAAARALMAGARNAGVRRLLIVGGAGSLEVAPGLQLVDAPTFPDLYKPEALAQRDALGVYRSEGNDCDWTYISPAGEIGDGKRTGRYRTGNDQLLVDDKGRSFISYEDYAAALIDELEQGKHVRRRITVAY
jgi:putative NADH-flavin reductase